MDRERLYEASPYNVVRLILGKDEPDDSANENKYTRAARSLEEWRSAGILQRSAEPCVYPYELTFRWAGRPSRIRGVIVEVDLEPPGGSIVPHERTMPGPIEDRLSLVRAVRANLSPAYVVLTSPAPNVAAFLEEAMGGTPVVELTDEAGTTHRLWAVPDAGPLPAAAAERSLMIADGHHRYTVALAYREEVRARRGAGPWDAMMMFVVDAGIEDPPVLPIHRLLAPAAPAPRALDGLPDAVRVRDMAEVLAGVRDEDLTFGVIEWTGPELAHRVGRVAGTPPTACALHGRF